ncbi:HNH endonuclease signature motif containing protein [Corynebacterium senegalense]|uniref:HNH endonuclease signature motif containing protein n=1 Tax=Corynebacterium senegalense TaxID=2080750 RepID=UPI000E1FCD4A|nr:HNH endonuclease signature motif containing protein [Corynebacterium senegalense]
MKVEVATLGPPGDEFYEAIEQEHRDGARLMIEAEYLIFGRFAWRRRDSDYAMEVTEIMCETQRGKRFVETGIDGYARLYDLPQLRDLQRQRKLLDVPRLSAIDKTLMLLPPDTPAEAWEVFDNELVGMFAGEALPSPWSITRRPRRLVATIDASVSFDRRKRAKREGAAAAPSLDFWSGDCTGASAYMTLTADSATMACLRAAVTGAAREKKLGLAEAAIALLTGATTPVARPVLHIFSPKGRAPSSYLPGFGWTGAESGAVLDDLLRDCPPDVVDLDDVAGSRVAGYAPAPKMADYVRARDGTCVFPGCHRAAESCQLDHRIPYGDGGGTTPGNLFALCQHHHNLKTDRRTFYIPDPVTGEIVWLFSNGRWAVSEDNGILGAYATPTAPRWVSTLDGNRASRAHAARFNAKCHALCDAFEAGGDLEACLAGIAELEEEFGLRFEFTPAGEDHSWLPPEPVDAPPESTDTVPDPRDYEWLLHATAA